MVIKADLKYLIGAMTDWIFKWRDSGWGNSREEEVANQKLFRDLSEAVGDWDGLDVEV